MEDFSILTKTIFCYIISIVALLLTQPIHWRCSEHSIQSVKFRTYGFDGHIPDRDRDPSS